MNTYRSQFVCSLSVAFDLTKDQRQSFGDDITTLLRLAKKRKWALQEERRIEQEIELQSHINSLLLAEKNRYCQSTLASMDDEMMLTGDVSISYRFG